MRRIRRKRTKGWKMPPNSVYIGRGKGKYGKWGNPLMLLGDTIFIDASYRRTIFSPWVILAENKDIVHMLDIYESLFYPSYLMGKYKNPDLRYWHEKIIKLNLRELKGKDLVCWCPLDKPCHGDILIRLCKQKFPERRKKVCPNCGAEAEYIRKVCEWCREAEIEWEK